MTKIKSLLIMLVALVVYSCSTNDINEEITDSETFNKEVIKNSKKNETNDTNSYRTIDEIEDLGLRMLWVSYMTAEVIMKDDYARRQFEEEFDATGGTNVVRLENLLSVDAPFDHFREAFKQEFLYHYHNNDGDGYSPCTGSGGGKPSGRPSPLTDGGGFILDDDELFNRYVNELLDDECLEYFL